MTTIEDVLKFRENGPWRDLVALAVDMVADAERHAGDVMAPLLGGGTRIMLAIGHRISHDVDLFIHDAQWIGYLTPRLNDKFEDQITGYEEDATWVKLKRRDGEVDFIVAGSLLNQPPEKDPALPFALESVEEVIAKKLFYRGWSLTARDLFDWKAVSEHPRYGHLRGLLAAVLPLDRRILLTSSLEKLASLPAAAAQWEAIRAPSRIPLSDAVAWAQDELRIFEDAPDDVPSCHP